MKHFLLPVLLLLSFACQAQSKKSQDSIYTYVEQMPEPGDGLGKYLSENLHYPDPARQIGIQGKVFLKFIVNEDGSIANCAVLKGIGAGCDEEALRVGKGMPAWKPGMHEGKNVKVWTSLPVLFKLEERTLADAVSKLPETKPVATYDCEKYIREHIQYPINAYVKKIQGEVLIGFIVNEDGSISDCNVQNGLGWGCDEAALKVVKSMPKWKPGSIDGKSVKSKTYLSVPFYISNDEKESIEYATVYNYVEQEPSPGFDIAAYLKQNVQYPEEATNKKTQGTVIVKFIVNQNGKIYDCRVIKGVGNGCDEEAVRIVKNMPHWKPGKQNGKPVKVYFTLPIIFKLAD